MDPISLGLQFRETDNKIFTQIKNYTTAYKIILMINALKERSMMLYEHIINGYDLK